MRVPIYTILFLMAGLIFADINFGSSVNDDQHAMIEEAIIHMEESGFSSDAGMLTAVGKSQGFRSSHIFSFISDFAEFKGVSFSYYAYTPVFSQSRIFFGSTFWDSGEIGRASVLIHEVAHIDYHRVSRLRGLIRHADEAQAYIRQYETYPDIGLTPYGQDGMVYWDMMIGIQRYVIPRYPEYAVRGDIAEAMDQLTQEVYEPMAEIAIILVFLALAALVLVGGDVLGGRVACALFARCRRPPLPQVGEWLLIPIALFVPLLILTGAVALLVSRPAGNTVEVLAHNFEVILLLAFFMTGLIGGLLTRRV